jgi:putative CocE/NonD family hydrolase
MKHVLRYRCSLVLLLFALAPPLAAQAEAVRQAYTKQEVYITMRDGVRLFTSIYTPKSAAEPVPFLMVRTPYSVGPYGAEAYRASLGPTPQFQQSGYIFVYQDVRGRYMSEGGFKWMTPFIPSKKSNADVDESSDTYDTIEWLIKNIPNNNGKVGQMGVSFPGFYTAAGMIEAHPALAASSPQAPMCDNWLGDDMHHNGAFWLPHAMNFIAGFGKKREGPTQSYGQRVFQHGTNDGYKFFLEMGALKNANTKYNMNQIDLWQQWMAHGDYDEYWQAQNVPQHAKNIKHAVMIVGGWFDAEDLYGPLALHRGIEEKNRTNNSTIVMGPWYHGSWGGGAGDTLHDIRFVERTGEFYRDQLQLPFFEYYLKGKGSDPRSEAVMFNTGANKWHKLDRWPPSAATPRDFYLTHKGDIEFARPAAGTLEYISDPANPVPSSAAVSTGMPRQYMIEDQRFVSARTDVLKFQTPVLTEDLTVCGPITATLYISTTGTDSDFVVKLIDAYPDDDTSTSPRNESVKMSGYQMLVRGEPIRAKYRDNRWANPRALVPNQLTKVEFVLPDVLHTFKRGHRMMVHIQSSWFPIVDRNPHVFTDIYSCDDSVFQKATQTVYFGGSSATKLTIGTLKD